MGLANIELRKYATEVGVRLWQIARAKGVSESTVTRWLRTELTPTEREAFKKLVDDLRDEKRGQNGNQ